jgi:hypothetical protein
MEIPEDSVEGLKVDRARGRVVSPEHCHCVGKVRSCTQHRIHQHSNGTLIRLWIRLGLRELAEVFIHKGGGGDHVDVGLPEVFEDFGGVFLL